MPSVIQEWVSNLPFMQQSVLLSSIRGPDGQAKYDPPKMLLRWFRRCVLISALDNEVLTSPCDQRGGSFTGPSCGNNMETQFMSLTRLMDKHVTEYIQRLDCIPIHFANHFRDAIEILGYRHPDPKIAEFWEGVYIRLVHEMHLNPESKEQMMLRLSDNKKAWLERSDVATQL